MISGRYIYHSSPKGPMTFIHHKALKTSILLQRVKKIEFYHYKGIVSCMIGNGQIFGQIDKEACDFY